MPLHPMSRLGAKAIVDLSRVRDEGTKYVFEMHYLL